MNLESKSRRSRRVHGVRGLVMVLCGSMMMVRGGSDL